LSPAIAPPLGFVELVGQDSPIDGDLFELVSDLGVARGVCQLIAFLGLRPAKFGSRHLPLSIEPHYVPSRPALLLGAIGRSDHLPGFVGCADSELVVFVRYSQRGCLGQEVGKLVGQQSRFLSARAPILGLSRSEDNVGYAYFDRSRPSQNSHTIEQATMTAQRGKYDC
jgi:hypothetical protein